MELSTALNGGTTCETTTGWQCTGLGWMNQSTKSASNNIIRALGLPLAADCFGGTCAWRGYVAFYASSTENGSSIYTRYLDYGHNTINRSLYAETYSMSVRCLKDY